MTGTADPTPWQMVKDVAPYVAALIALAGTVLTALVALGGTVTTAVITLKRGNLDARNAYAAEILKFRLRQVEEFYAPALLAIEQSRIVYDKMLWVLERLKGKGYLKDFRLLDHIHDLRKDPDAGPFVNRILAIGERLTALISTHAALIEGGITPTFIEYQAHFEILNAAAKQRLTEPQADGWHEFGYFPRLLNREIHEGYKIVLRHLEDYAEAGDRVIARLLRHKLENVRAGAEQLLEHLHYYETNAEEYAKRFDDFDLSASRNAFVRAMERSRIGARRRVLDAGCGSGRDLLAFVKEGIEVTGIDASPALLRLTRRKLRDEQENATDPDLRSVALSSRCLEMTFDEVRFREEFHGIWAAASLLHVPRYQLVPILKRFSAALKTDGILFMSFTYGRGDRKRGARTFSCHDGRSMRALLRRVENLKVVDLWLSDPGGSRLPAARALGAWFLGLLGRHDTSLWLNVLVRRTTE